MGKGERQEYLQLVTRKLVILTAGCVVVLAIFLYIALTLFETQKTYLVSTVFIIGLTGGFVSIQQRLPSIDIEELRMLSNSWWTILLIPVNGGIFALVLMMMFLSGLVKGAMFPEYIHLDLDHKEVFKSYVAWLYNTFPNKGEDIAKLFFWSFVAGFSERFVPQIIRKTVKKNSH